MKFNRIHNISLKWKLLIPFLFLASMGALALFLVSYRFQAQLIHLNEEKRLSNKYYYFLDMIESKKRQMLSLATLIAHDPDVVEAFALRDRARLLKHLSPAYEQLTDSHDVRQLHFHVPPAVSFLRLHMPDLYGDDLESYRHTINTARKTGKKVGGLEKGVAGFGLRGVVPVWFEGRQIGTLEVGSSFGTPFVEYFSHTFDADVSIYVSDQRDKAMVLASTNIQSRISPALFHQVLTTDQPAYRTDTWQDQAVAFIVGPVKNYSNETVAVAVISVDRSQTLALLSKYRNTAILVGLVGLVLSISFIWFISVVFTNRIGTVVEASRQIASGHRETRIAVKGADEIGVMADAINEMLGSLEESRVKVRSYADNLERMVEQRTRALEESEQTYRALVQHVPLIVYSVLSDSTALFLNEYTEEVIGVSAQQLNGHHKNWIAYIHADDRDRVARDFDVCLRGGNLFHSEYRVVHHDGHSVHVLDQAVPVRDDRHVVVRMDGIILDITAQKELQQKIIQAEELETLGEVSARLAHEIRNPLTSIGGMTRRLVKSFEASDDRKRKGELIVEEVGRLEKILKMMTAYIEPEAITLRRCDLNEIVSRAVDIVNKTYEEESFSVHADLAPDLHKINLDKDLFENVLVSLLKNAYFRMKQRGDISVTTNQGNGQVMVTIVYSPPFIADDDIEHFFYPFVVDYPFQKGGRDTAMLDVPICRVLIHKHGGMIHVSKENENVVKIVITLPRALRRK